MVAMGKLKEQFRIQNLLLEHPDPTSFVQGRVKNHPKCYLIWRLLWALYHVCWLVSGLVITSLDDERDVGKWFIYLSNWVYILLTFGCLAEAVLVCGTFRKGPPRHEEPDTLPARPLPRCQKLTWCLSGMTSTGCVMVTLWYWLWQARGKSLTALRLHYHGINALYVFGNIIVSRTPIRLLHCVYPMAFGFLYTAFGAVYYYCGGTNQNGEHFIYKVVDWSNPGRAIILTSISNCIFIPLVHLLLWAISVGVEKLIAKYLPKQHEKIENVSFGEDKDEC